MSCVSFYPCPPFPVCVKNTETFHFKEMGNTGALFKGRLNIHVRWEWQTIHKLAHSSRILLFTWTPPVREGRSCSHLIEEETEAQMNDTFLCGPYSEPVLTQRCVTFIPGGGLISSLFWKVFQSYRPESPEPGICQTFCSYLPQKFTPSD